MRILFMGSPQLAIPSLEAAREVGELVGVVTQSPKASGRGRKVSPSAVGSKAAEWGIDPLVPNSVKTDDFIETAAALAPDIALVVAYGKILPPGLLAVPRLGCVNVHASLLPELRGAAPIQWAIAHGLNETGVTLMQMDEGMDTGPMLLQKSTTIGVDETAGELGKRLSIMGAELVKEGLPALYRGELPPQEQDSSAATYAPLLSKEDGRIDFCLTAGQIANRVRGFSQWPGTFTIHNGNRVLVTRAVAVGGSAGPETGSVPESRFSPGAILQVGNDGITVVCGTGTLLITTVKPEGKREMTAGEYISGYSIKTGDILGQ